MGTGDKLLRPAEVCTRLNINNDTMHALIKQGQLRAIRLGPKSTRIYADSLDQLLEKGRNSD